MLEIIEHSKVKIGIKQASRALAEGIALKLFVAMDADVHLTQGLIRLAEENSTEIIYVNTMRELGRACKIDVGAATAVIIK